MRRSYCCPEVCDMLSLGCLAANPGRPSKAGLVEGKAQRDVDTSPARGNTASYGVYWEQLTACLLIVDFRVGPATLAQIMWTAENKSGAEEDHCIRVSCSDVSVRKFGLSSFGQLIKCLWFHHARNLNKIFLCTSRSVHTSGLI